MKVRALVPVLLAVATIGGAAWWWRSRAGDDAWAWRTATVERTDVRKVVSATGTLTADPQVEVGTQVSGIVAEILVDFNDEVKAGQVLARIDTSLLEADVASATARLAEARAARERLGLELQRMEALHARKAVSDQEIEAARADHAVAVAQARSAQVALDRARRNLGYATIQAPIDGTVVRRDVEPGQTVNAGFSAPTLFQLAGDLSRMLILVDVDESDIGQIRPEQAVDFTVQAYPERTFHGAVRQVRLASKREESVVTYTAVVDVPNEDRTLFPGMTATVEFIVAEAKGALCVANGALRFRPDDALPVAGERPKGPALWTLEAGTLRALPVETGLRGADCTEVSGDGVAEGLDVVVGVDREAAGGGTSPFEQKKADPRRPPGGF